jgi:uncharacterized SAM-binding protein YcdF (DUF218 family)
MHYYLYFRQKMITEETIALAQKIWDYHHVINRLEKADCVLALGSHDVRVAERAAELYLQHWAPLLIFSGGLGRLTEDMWTETEADKFAKIAMDMGVPKEKILIENKSTNTGENILFTQQLLERNHLHVESFIVVQKPYMERRSFATFKKHWPEKKLIVTSPQISFHDYPNDEISMEKVIHIMIGDLQRIKIYAEKGFQIYQPIPADIWQAFEKLVKLGFNEQLI